MDLLKDGLLKMGISEALVSDCVPKMEAYIKEIILYNSAYNLTNTSDHDELVTRHILDSLAPYNVINRLVVDKQAGAQELGEEILVGDIGSGGGLPGIPLASLFPRVRFNLVERMAKRCAFLENCCAVLGLRNVEVVNSEAERVDPESYDIITFRAFRPLDKKMTKTLLRMTKEGGVLCAYKAKRENINEEMDGIKDLISSYTVEPLMVPGLEDSERNLVIINK